MGDMNGKVTPSGLWLPGTGKHDGGKRDGGTWFDDELEDARTVFLRQAKELIGHINERADHVVYVGSTDDRAKLREVFNWWKREGIIGRNPKIEIEYGIPEGAIRVTEPR